MCCSYQGYLAARVLWAAGSSLYNKVHFSFIFGLITYLLVLLMTIKHNQFSALDIFVNKFLFFRFIQIKLH